VTGDRSRTESRITERARDSQFLFTVATWE
jgi:hypothetical protein